MATPNHTQRARVADPDRIIVNGLVVDTYIGVHDFERDATQRVRFDIAIETVDGLRRSGPGHRRLRLVCRHRRVRHSPGGVR